jgi:hypothetical protein
MKGKSFVTVRFGDKIMHGLTQGLKVNRSKVFGEQLDCKNNPD